MKSLIADSIAAVVFFTLLAGVSEHVIAGMTLEQVLAARLAAIPITLATGRPYGIWRDRIFRLFHANRSPRLRRTLLDIAVFLSFQVPVYIVILNFAGASLEQMARAMPMAVVMMIAVSRFYGLFLDRCRRLAGVSLSNGQPG